MLHQGYFNLRNAQSSSSRRCDICHFTFQPGSVHVTIKCPCTSFEVLFLTGNQPDISTSVRTAECTCVFALLCGFAQAFAPARMFRIVN